MGSLSGKRTNPGNSRSGGQNNVFWTETDPVADEALENIEQGVLRPDMSREFGVETLDHLEYEVLPAAIKANDSVKAKLCEKVLAKYGRAVPNHVSGLWEPLDVPRNELQVRELFASRLPEYGYNLVCSQADFPDWLLVDTEGNFVYTEVEHRSFSFKRHGHDAQGCDLIVCWEHDWPLSPLPVLELFSGRVFAPKKPVERSKWKGRLGVNFAGRLRRFREVQNTTAQVDGRHEYICKRYQELEEQGIPRPERVRTIAREIGKTVEPVYSVLRKQGFSVPPANRRGQMVNRVEDLLAEGYMKREAILKTAEEFEVKSGTVESHLSRYKNRS